MKIRQWSNQRISQMNKNIKEQLWSARWKIITLKSNLNKCSNLSQPLDKLNLVGRLIATLHWFLTACWWKFWKRIERWKTWHLSNILHPDHVPTNAQSIFFFTLSWTTSSQPLGAGQWIVRSRQLASWATRSTRRDLTKSSYKGSRTDYIDGESIFLTYYLY